MSHSYVTPLLSKIRQLVTVFVRCERILTSVMTSLFCDGTAALPPPSIPQWICRQRDWLFCPCETDDNYKPLYFQCHTPGTPIRAFESSLTSFPLHTVRSAIANDTRRLIKPDSGSWISWRRQTLEFSSARADLFCREI